MQPTVFFQCHKLCAHSLYAIPFISVTFNKILAMEELKLTQNVHTESLSADVSGMVRSGYSELQIKETEAISSLLFLVDLTTNPYNNLNCVGHSETPGCK